MPHKRRVDGAKNTLGQTKAESANGRDQRPRRGVAKDLIDYKVMHALSRSERVEILSIFIERGIASPKAIALERDASLSKTSYHVNVLRRAGLLELDHEVPRRGAVEHFYRPTTPTLVPAGTWDNLPSAVQASLSVSVLRDFFDDASAAAEAGLLEDPRTEISWTPLVLDAAGARRVEKLARTFVTAVIDVQAEANERLSAAADSRDAVSLTVWSAPASDDRSGLDFLGLSLLMS